MYKIAVSGKANSGKNTLTDLLTNGLGGIYSTKHKAFADPIKEGLLKMYSTAVREDLYGPSSLRAKLIPGKKVTYRKLLCDLGALGRSYDEEHWVKILMEDYKSSCLSNLPPTAYIVNDLRFPNELIALQEEGFLLVRIKREDSTVINDVSETSQDSIPDSAFHFVIENNDTIDHLGDRAADIVKAVKSIIR